VTECLGSVAYVDVLDEARVGVVLDVLIDWKSGFG